MLVNVYRHKVYLPSQIVTVKETTYLGIKISLNVTAKLNYLSVLKKTEGDINGMDRWKHLSALAPARNSVNKMNVLSRINFWSPMIPLTPPYPTPRWAIRAE